MKTVIFILILSSTAFGGIDLTNDNSIDDFSSDFFIDTSKMTGNDQWVITKTLDTCNVYVVDTIRYTHPPVPYYGSFFNNDVDSISKVIDTSCYQKNKWAIIIFEANNVNPSQSRLVNLGEIENIIYVGCFDKPLRMKIDTLEVVVEKRWRGKIFFHEKSVEYDTTYYLTPEQVKLLESIR